MNTNDGFILEFLDKDTFSALPAFLDSDSYEESAAKIARAFGYQGDFSRMDKADVKRLVVSFKNNLSLLIQKTWVEKSDITLKDQLLYKMEQFLKEEKWAQDFPLFLEIINQAVYLMFGQKTDTPDFEEYALRIDPDFGIFWWYTSKLPRAADWKEEKYKTAMLLGMYFLANY